MLKMILYRVLTFPPVLCIVGVFAFRLVNLAPGSPAQYILGDAATPDSVAQINRALGVDKPVVEQFIDWAGGAVHGDFGTSLFSSQSAAGLVLERLPATLSLASAALLLAALVGVSLGSVAALRPGGFLDRLTVGVSSMSVAVPSFLLAIVMAYYFTVRFQWFPTLGYTPLSESVWLWLKGITLPAVALAIPASAVLARHSRTQMTEVLHRDYIRAARAKGVPKRTLVVRQAPLRNAATPIVTLGGVQFVTLLGGTVIIEQIFSVPGVGRLAVQAAQTKDFPIVQALVALAAVAVLTVNLAVDVINGFVNPKLRAS